MENWEIIRDVGNVSENRTVAIGPVAMKLLGQSAVKFFERWQDERIEQQDRSAAANGYGCHDSEGEIVAHAASLGQLSLAGSGQVMPPSRRSHSQ